MTKAAVHKKAKKETWKFVIHISLSEHLFTQPVTIQNPILKIAALHSYIN